MDVLFRYRGPDGFAISFTYQPGFSSEGELNPLDWNGRQFLLVMRAAPDAGLHGSWWQELREDGSTGPPMWFPTVLRFDDARWIPWSATVSDELWELLRAEDGL